MDGKGRGYTETPLNLDRITLRQTVGNSTFLIRPLLSRGSYRAYYPAALAPSGHRALERED
jgi:hypothetical protein